MKRKKVPSARFRSALLDSAASSHFVDFISIPSIGCCDHSGIRFACISGNSLIRTDRLASNRVREAERPWPRGGN